MKTVLVRGFVLALALIGFTASTQVSSATATKVSVVSSNTIPPSCDPNDPNACGVD